MKPIINLEETIGKTVGSRKVPADAFEYGMQVQRVGAQLQRRLGAQSHPRGVFKFHSHEEADAWLLKYQAWRK